MCARTQRELSGPLAIYVSVVALTGVVVVLESWLRAGSLAAIGTAPWGLVFWTLFAVASECFWISLPGDRGMVSMGLAADLAMLFALPLPHALLVAGVSVLLTDLLVHHRGGIRSLFNSTQTVISLSLAAGAMILVDGSIAPRGSGAFLQHPVAALLTLPAFCILNTGLVSAAIAIDTERSWWRSWRDSFGFAYHYQSCAILFSLGWGSSSRSRWSGTFAAQ